MNNEITILPFAESERFNGLKAAIGKLPYTTNFMSPDQWLQPGHSEAERAIVALVNGSEIPDQAVYRRFEALVNTPKLCLLGDSRLMEQRAIIDRYDDVMIWPCSVEEMSYRIRRVLAPQLESPGSKPFDDTLRKAFIEMNLIGESPAFVRALSGIEKASRNDITVLLLGETGTGKELAARAIHYLGPHAAHPFIPVNCGALPEEIFENEVFGHAQGAYTDARTSQLGLVGQAQGGTLFLDEVDTLSLKSQVGLLRFLQDHQYRPLGAQGYVKADVRLIAATNADLSQLVRKGLFRADLYFRLNILQINMPALRDRAEDLPLLARHMIRGFETEYGGTERFLPSINHAWMRVYAWPGNVRELENVLLRAYLESEAPALLVPPPVQLDEGQHSIDISGVDWGATFNEARNSVMGVFEKNYLTHLLSRTDGNITKAARLAGKERRSLGKLVKKHGLKQM